MKAVGIYSVLLSLGLMASNSLVAATVQKNEPKNTLENQPAQPAKNSEPVVGSWTFSGTVTNESGDHYGYFFQMQKQGTKFHAKTALIDGHTNKLVLFYEGDELIESVSHLNWHVGSSFMRYNPINDSWIFGVKVADKKGFNFKVDMLEQNSSSQETQLLRPGVELQAIQTSRLNGHVQTGSDAKEEFVTGDKAWFGRLWFSKDQKSAHDIGTTFCRLANNNGFYSANLKEADATSAAIAGWRDAEGLNVKMSQFISIKSLTNNEHLLKIGVPKLNLKLFNTLNQEGSAPYSLAGFSKNNPLDFCFVTEQSFAEFKAAPEAVA